MKKKCSQIQPKFSVIWNHKVKGNEKYSDEESQFLKLLPFYNFEELLEGSQLLKIAAFSTGSVLSVKQNTTFRQIVYS